jgi:hypothetical protein
MGITKPEDLGTTDYLSELHSRQFAELWWEAMMAQKYNEFADVVSSLRSEDV